MFHGVTFHPIHHYMFHCGIHVYLWTITRSGSVFGAPLVYSALVLFVNGERKISSGIHTFMGIQGDITSQCCSASVTLRYSRMDF